MRRMLDTDRPPVRCLGLFDTVASVIESGRFGPRLRSHAFRVVIRACNRSGMRSPRMSTEQCSVQLCGRPAENIEAILSTSLEKLIKTCGRCGSTGATPTSAAACLRSSALAKEALRWMIDQTAPMGVRYVSRTVRSLVLGQGAATNSAGKTYVARTEAARSMKSMTPLWALLEFLPRRKAARSHRPAIFGWTIPFFERGDSGGCPSALKCSS